MHWAVNSVTFCLDFQSVFDTLDIITSTSSTATMDTMDTMETMDTMDAMDTAIIIRYRCCMH